MSDRRPYVQVETIELRHGGVRCLSTRRLKCCRLSVRLFPSQTSIASGGFWRSPSYLLHLLPKSFGPLVLYLFLLLRMQVRSPYMPSHACLRKFPWFANCRRSCIMDNACNSVCAPRAYQRVSILRRLVIRRDMARLRSVL